MLVVIVGMVVAVLIASAVLAVVVVPALREGRDVLTPEGEELVADLRDRTSGAVEVVKDRAVAASEVVKDKVSVGGGPERDDDAPSGASARGPQGRQRS